MAERSSKRPKKEHDFAVTAFRVMQEATAEGEETIQVNVAQSSPREPGDKNPNAVALGRLGGKKGGKARAAKLTAAERKDIARKAAIARWSKAKPTQ